MSSVCIAMVLGFGLAAWGQDAPAPQPAAPQQTPAQQNPATPPPAPAPDAAQPVTQPQAPDQQTQPPAATPAPAQASTPAASPSGPEEKQAGAITEEELKALLVGKPLYLRGGYLDNTLTFNENGGIVGHSPQGSYTLSAIAIDKVHLTKHKVELEGARYGLHFLGALPYEDPTKALDRVKITPKKKVVKITIDRELVVTPKKKKDKQKEGKARAQKAKSPATVATASQPASPPASQATNPSTNPPAPPDAQPGPSPASSPAPSPDQAATQTAQSAPPAPPSPPAAPEPTDADQARAEMAAAPEAERPADPNSVTTTLSPAHATKVLKNALDKIFATGLDDRMMAAMPDFWKLYYQAVAAKSDYKPSDASVLRQNTVDTKARLVSKFEPESNEFAQANGVAGMALYHTVIGADGKPGEIAVARPIGFGLDENAVAAIRKASFEPATKDGKPVPVMLDLVVQFRIYSHRTAVTGKSGDEANSGQKQLPGPYSLKPLNQ
ncbi:MAG: energy transducer TonB [Terracidiphilus sp.]